MKEIHFKYHPNVWKQNIFRKVQENAALPCQCCGKDTAWYLENMYAVENISCICPDCVASGQAAVKFDGTFIQDADLDQVDDPAKIAELFQRTPGYHSWQGEYWLACCNDFCAYLGEVGTKELEEMGIADEVFTEYDTNSQLEQVRPYLTKSGSLCGYLFQCLHCGKYHLGVDAD